MNSQIEAWEEYGLTRVPVSMAPPLRYVNSYVLRGEEGITIIDPGPHTAATEAEWREFMRELKLDPKDVSSIIITHHHPDHYGLAGYLQQWSGAPVYMSHRAHEETLRMWGAASTMNEDLLKLYREHGMPADWTAQLPAHMESFMPQVNPTAEVSYIHEGDQIRMGGQSWRAIETAGHAPGHLSFYDERRGLMLCGDAVLPQISPNVSLMPGSDPQPLESFMNSLRRLEQYEVALAFPGHRRPFSHFAERISMLLKHHEERLEVIAAMLAKQPLSGFAVCTGLFGTGLGIHQMRFAMSEALAHLVELERRGYAVQIPAEGETALFVQK
ncbi:MBL fold metallo-hydrolase [Paenibacillus aceti]|uniref:MBL fold metallo-hydrolase n=1 Tax=Paenibacillus aceti TaxID=1820010 RepID=A0ABQ1VQC5_9BACL|nr:MBL fold metallo-hydrolase [Paenibacillus aceti]GGF89589.1 MBL fold metallo-hydrolase [Paenibacillus aceti]